MVEDTSGTGFVTFWNSLAVQLLGKTAIQLDIEMPEEVKSSVILCIV